jgi:uncharacterized membrane protein YczE
MALGFFLVVRANIGLSPWTALAIGCSNLTGASFGKMMIAVSMLVIIVDLLLKEKLGFATILNGLMIGTFIEIIESMELIPLMSDFLPGLLLLLLGQAFVCLGTYYYIGVGLGCGPRDALMVAIGKRCPRVSIGVVRSTLEGGVLCLGWLMGAKIGLGTVVYVFGIGIMLQLTFTALRFDVKSVVHEDVFDTIRAFRRNIGF